jgi:hypothetical protein
MIVVFEQQMIRRPPGGRADATRLFQREQELVANERITPQRQRIPLRGGDAVDAGDDTRGGH